MRNNRLFAVVEVGMMAVIGCSLCNCTRKNTGAEKPGPAELPKEQTIDLGGGVMMEFVLVPAGSFLMGSDNDEAERPIHRVTISKAFYLAKHEVTQEQWKIVMGGNPSRFEGLKNPVDSVSWYDCQDFLAKLNDRVPGRELRLPTEAEWEYACRAGGTGAYCYGDGEDRFYDDGGHRLADYAWYDSNTIGTTHPVGGKKPNVWGLRDMHGNVYEWCADWYADYPATAVTDPQGPSSGSDRVFRGGSWVSLAYDCRVASRHGSYPGHRYNAVGFRPARSSDP